MKNSSINEQTRIAEIKLTGFLAEHNLPIASADHLTSLVRECFPDSKIAKLYACSHTKASCILNGAICPDLKESLVEDMNSSVFSLSTDDSNDQNLDKMNPLTVCMFDINQHKVVTKFFNMCLSKSATAVGIFSSIDQAMSASNIPWENCIALGVDNTSVNVGKHNSLIVEARKKNEHIILIGCPCHIAHNTASKSTKAFCGSLCKNFDVEELLIGIYFHFDYSSKERTFLQNFVHFVIKTMPRS